MDGVGHGIQECVTNCLPGHRGWVPYADYPAGDPVEAKGGEGGQVDLQTDSHVLEDTPLWRRGLFATQALHWLWLRTSLH